MGVRGKTGYRRANSTLAVEKLVTEFLDASDRGVNICGGSNVRRRRRVIRRSTSCVQIITRIGRIIVCVVGVTVVTLIAITLAFEPHRLDRTSRGVEGKDLTLVLIIHRAVRTALNRQRGWSHGLRIKGSTKCLHRSRLRIKQRDL